jgi:hypothetical protein
MKIEDIDLRAVLGQFAENVSVLLLLGDGCKAFLTKNRFKILTYPKNLGTLEQIA